MAWLVLLAVIALPVVEIELFVESSEAFGVLPTLAAAILAGMCGIVLLQQQGLSLLFRARAQLARGEIPLDAGFDALCLALAGVLLVLPGFLTDALGLLLLLPPVRQGLRWWLGRRLGRAAVAKGYPPDGHHPHPPVIEGDYHVVDRDHRG